VRRLEGGAAAAAARRVAQAAAAALPSGRAAAVAAAHKQAALAQRRAAKKRGAPHTYMHWLLRTRAHTHGSVPDARAFVLFLSSRCVKDAADAAAWAPGAPPPPCAAALDRDLLACVFGALDARALARAACVCRGWRAEAGADVLWRPLFAATFAARRTRRSTPAAPAGGALPRGAACWRDAFAAAARASPGAVAERTCRALCTRCGALTWLPTAQHAPAAAAAGVSAPTPTSSASSAAPARVRRAHSLVSVSPAGAARRTLRALALLPPRAGSSSSGGSGEEGGSDGSESDDGGACVGVCLRACASISI
jgi:hypothetical protein